MGTDAKDLAKLEITDGEVLLGRPECNADPLRSLLAIPRFKPHLCLKIPLNLIALAANDHDHQPYQTMQSQSGSED